MSVGSGLDSVLTLAQRMLGVMQPRPVSTLHVGGAITSDDVIAGTGLAVSGNASVGGTLGVTGQTTLAGMAAGLTRVSQLNIGAGAVGGITGDVACSRDSAPATGVYYFGNTTTKYLYYDGTNYQLVGGRLNAQLNPGTAQALVGQYFGAVANWAVPGINTWYESPVQCSVTFTGAPIRIEWNLLSWIQGSSNGDLQVAVGLGGVVGQQVGYMMLQPNIFAWSAGVYYMTPGAGATRVSLFVKTAFIGASLPNYCPSSLYVTEQRC
jgi:hypothetical protein